jgi:hypothetical protein
MPPSLYLVRIALALLPREKKTHAEAAKKAIPTKM